MSEIVHVVLVEWNDEGAAAQADELTARHLPGIPGVLSVDHGPSTSAEGLEAGFEWALVVRFVDAHAVAEYLPHPEHVVVGTYLQQHARRLVVFDVAAS